MSIVTVNSGAYDRPGGLSGFHAAVDTRYNEGKLRGATGTIANAATDNNGSVYNLVRVPSVAVLRPESVIDLQSWGFVVANLGVVGAESGLLAVADTTLLAAVSNPITLFGAKWNKELWEAVGLAADPGGYFDIALFTAADAAGAGSATFDFVWQAD